MSFAIVFHSYFHTVSRYAIRIVFLFENLVFTWWKKTWGIYSHPLPPLDTFVPSKWTNIKKSNITNILSMKSTIIMFSSWSKKNKNQQLSNTSEPRVVNRNKNLCILSYFNPKNDVLNRQDWCKLTLCNYFKFYPFFCWCCQFIFMNFSAIPVG